MVIAIQWVAYRGGVDVFGRRLHPSVYRRPSVHQLFNLLPLATVCLPIHPTILLATIHSSSPSLVRHSVS